VVKNSQELDRFFTLLRQKHSGGQAGFHFGHKKKSVRKLNKVKFQGFLWASDFSFLYRPDEVHDSIFHR
jgi:hypothetical protein